MILTSANIQAKYLLSGCCLADLGIKYVQALNLGDYDLQECIMDQMKELYFLRKAICDFVPADELTPSITGNFSSLGSMVDGTIVLYVNDVQISSSMVFSNTPRLDAMLAIVADVNQYQTEYIASYNYDSGSSTISLTITSTVPGTTQNGYIVALVYNGSSVSGPLAGGTTQWCLTDTQALSIIKKIEDLCNNCCGCNDNILNDNLPKYV